MHKLREAFVFRWKAAKSWAKDGRPFWLWLVVAAAMLGIPYLLPAQIFSGSAGLVDRIRWSGMLFQVTGLATVIWHLNESSGVVYKSPLYVPVLTWLQKFLYIIKPRRPVTHSLNVQSAVGRMVTSDISSVSAIGATDDLKRRIDALEVAHRKLRSELSDLNQKFDESERQTRERIDDERRQREAGDREIVDRFTKVIVGGITIELAGVAFLFVGIVFTSIPSELACALNWIGL